MSTSKSIKTPRTPTKRKLLRVGANQHHRKPIIADFPELPRVIQQYINLGLSQKEIPDKLESDYGLKLSVRTVQRNVQVHQLKTVRKCELIDEEKHAVIAELIQKEDPGGKWGARRTKNELARKGVHISRDFIGDALRKLNPEANESRRPVANGPLSRQHAPSPEVREDYASDSAIDSALYTNTTDGSTDDCSLCGSQVSECSD